MLPGVLQHNCYKRAFTKKWSFRLKRNALCRIYIVYMCSGFRETMTFSCLRNSVMKLQTAVSIYTYNLVVLFDLSPQTSTKPDAVKNSYWSATSTTNNRNLFIAWLKWHCQITEFLGLHESHLVAESSQPTAVVSLRRTYSPGYGAVVHKPTPHGSPQDSLRPNVTALAVTTCVAPRALLGKDCKIGSRVMF